MIALSVDEQCRAICKKGLNAGRQCQNRKIGAMEARDKLKHYRWPAPPNEEFCATHAWDESSGAGERG